MSRKKELVLCIDIGGDSIKASEFLCVPGNSMELRKFAFSEYGIGENPAADDNSYSFAMLYALKKIIEDNHFEAKKVNISISGQNAFIRFVKVPAMTTNEEKIKQILKFEATQNIPFPPDQVIWDYQLIPNPEDDSELDAMFVLVRSDEIEKIVDIIEQTGKKIGIIEAAPTSCYNAARANGIGDEYCEMILNIGGRCSTLIFIDKDNFFVRTILIAGHTITQQISKEFGISFSEAEELKRRHGFVALGGAYEEPDSEVAAVISKIVRNVMTRLHGEINRSINVYRAQQGGPKPEKLYLAGGSSVMAFTPRFFSEKLRIPVEYMNPFQVVSIANTVDKAKLTEIAHLYSESIGLGLREVTPCPIELSLVPERIEKQRIFQRKKIYFYASCVALLLCLFITYYGFSKQAENIIDGKDKAFAKVQTTKRDVKDVAAAKRDLDQVTGEYQRALELLKGRNRWINLLNQIQVATPPEIWFTSLGGASTVETRAAAADTYGGAQTKRSGGGDPGGFGGFGGFESPMAESRSAQQTTVSPDYRFIVFDGYIRTENAKRSPSAIYEDFIARLEKTGLFEKFTMNDKDRMMQNLKFATGGSNISSFRIEAKLKEPIKP